jgi:protein O-GlcNAc transferase
MSQRPDELLDRAEEHHRAGRLHEAIELYHETLKLDPLDADAYFLLALAMFQAGRVTESVEQARQAIELDPTVPEFRCDLGKFLFALNDIEGSIAASRKALELRPEFPEALFNLGNALCKKELFEDGIDAYQRAIALRGEDPDALNNQGMALLNLGRIDEAIACFDRILTRNANDAAAHSNRIYALHFHPSWDAAAIRRELVKWNDQHARPLKRTITPHENDRSANRPLRVGFVSADFREHVVGWNILPFLREYDHSRFQVFCYSNVRNPDGLTREIQSHAYVWRDIVAVSDERAAQIIRDDRIDILVDLSVHTGGNRLLVFARKPAPIQVTYLGYPGSTGLEAIDYRLSDPFLDSDDEIDHHTERTIRLPHTYWCYRLGGTTPDVVPPPAASTGFITFGCLNQFQKVSAPAMDLWQRIMNDVPGSRLVLHAPAGSCRDRMLGSFGDAGVAPDRIKFVERLPWAGYIDAYQRIDIALDPFPYGGGITTCDALWMGVPVITLCGTTAVGRSATSILGNLELHRLIAHLPNEYVSIAGALARDVSRLTQLRSSLREQMRASTLMDSRQFARDIESAFVSMWNDWIRMKNE